MSDLSFIFSSLKSRSLNSLLSVFLTAFGVMLALIIIQFGHHVQNRLSADGQGIDIVVGAKGSPLQLILSSVYHIDIPTGNIPYDDAQKWMKHPHIKSAIPLALGDNWKGYRIVGTTVDYMTHYGAEISEGRLWNKEFEAIAGSSAGLHIGDEFEWILFWKFTDRCILIIANTSMKHIMSTLSINIMTNTVMDIKRNITSMISMNLMREQNLK